MKKRIRNKMVWGIWGGISLVVLMTLYPSLSVFADHVSSRNEGSGEEPIYTNEKHKNETLIEFKANDGQTTSAYQGYYTVPENRDRKDSRNIDIHYVRFPATGTRKGPPVVYLAGGPGGSGIDTAKWKRFPLFMALRQYGDVIALDQRGTGLSKQASECQSSIALPLDKVVPPKTVLKSYRMAALECVDRWKGEGIDIYGYTTVQNAWDLNDLRKHLGVEKISLWGISYGSHLALAALSLFENHIHKVILASVEGLDQTVKLPARTDNFFQRVQELIDVSKDQKARHPSVAQLMQSVHAQLAEEPILIRIPREGMAPQSFLLQREHMQILTAMMIGEPNYLPFVLQIYEALSQGDSGLVTQVLSRGMFSDEYIKFEMMPLMMDIASGISRSRMTLIKRQAKKALLGDVLNFPMPQLNGLLPGLDLGKEFRRAKVSDVPVLLFSGTLDGRTYLEGQVEATEHLTSLTHVKVVNAGHNLFMSSPEVLRVMERFIANIPLVDLEIKVEPPTF